MQDLVAPTQTGVSEGDILAGKYRIEKILGIGGMGVVVAAHHIHLDAKVAIKFLLPEALSNQETVERFTREARAAVKIKSERVARVIDVGTLESGAPYMVMEYLEGCDLAVYARRHQPLPVELVVEFVIQACEAIAESHSLGIIHRDLKPSNLFCIRRSDGLLAIKVLDFGISKTSRFGATDSDLNMTNTTAVMGSPLYMSPEQMQSSRDVDARTDIWALGVILYELLAGRVPFEAEALSEICIKTALHPPTPLRNYRPDAPLELEAIILKCLSKDRDNRYRNVAQLATALLPWSPLRAHSCVEHIQRIIQTAGLSECVIEAMPESHANSPGTPSSTQSSWGHTKSLSKWGRATATLAVALFALATLAALRWIMNSHKSVAPQVAGVDSSRVNGASRVADSTLSSPLTAGSNMTTRVATNGDAGVQASQVEGIALARDEVGQKQINPGVKKGQVAARTANPKAQTNTSNSAEPSRGKPLPNNDPFSRPH